MVSFTILTNLLPNEQLQSSSRENGILLIGYFIVIGLLIWFFVRSQSNMATLRDNHQKLIDTVKLQDAQQKAGNWACLGNKREFIENQVKIAQQIREKLKEIKDDKTKQENIFSEIKKQIEIAQEYYSELCNDYDNLEDLRKKIQRLIDANKIDGRDKINARSEALILNFEGDLEMAKKNTNYADTLKVLKETYQKIDDFTRNPPL